MSNTVLDSSALLALVLNESGAAVVAQAVEEGAFCSAVNLCEVITRLLDLGQTEEEIEKEIEKDLQSLRIETPSFETTDAWRTGRLRVPTRRLGLSLGDRACLALGAVMDLPVITADRGWAGLDVGVNVQICR